MTPDADRRAADETEADLVFEDFVARRADDPELDFEALCRIHPDLESELRRRHDTWRRLSAVFEGWGGAATPLGALETSAAEDARVVFGPLFEALGRRLVGFDRYDVGETIGRGGMGEVARVWDRELERHLAMKRLRTSPGGAATGPTPHDELLVVGRFLTEARVTAQLDHPSILPVHELGLDPDGRLFFTMPLVEGLSLLDILERGDRRDGEWTVPRAVTVLQRACEALASAHEKGVVHRDLKPSNIMVGRFGEVYVMDWGLAKVREPAPEVPGPARSPGTERSADSGRGSTVVWTPDLATLAGGVLGTPEYMPPEQARGDGDAIGPSADVYSLGAILYHLLAGRPPYHGDGARRDPARVLERVRNEAPAALGELARHQPPELVAVCERAMERDAARRYRTMGELADDLRSFTENRVVKAYRTGAVVELSKWFGRNRATAWTGVAALVLVLGGTIWVAADKSAQAANERELKQIADRSAAESERERSRAEREAARNIALSDFFQLVFDAANPRLGQGEVVTVRALLERGVAQVREALRDDPEGLGIILRAMGSTHRDLGHLEDARVLLEESCAILTAELGARHRETSMSAGELAILYQEIGRFDEAAALFDSAYLGLSDTAPLTEGSFDLGLLKAQSNRATILTVQGEYEAAANIQEEVLASARAELGDEHSLTRSVMVRLARIYRYQGRLDAAEPLMRAALPEVGDIAAERNPDLLDAYRSLVGMRLEQGRVEEAYTLGGQLLEAHEHVFGTEHQYTAMALQAVATAAKDTGRFEEAETLATRVVALRRELLGEGHAETWASVSLLASVLRALGRRDRAEQLHRETLEGLLESVGPEHPYVGIARYNLAAILTGVEQAPEVVELLKGALASFRRTHAANHPLVIGTLDKLARKSTVAGDLEEAEAYAREAVGLAPEGSAIAIEAQHTLDVILESRREVVD